jgi:hypothetical protein
VRCLSIHEHWACQVCTEHSFSSWLRTQLLFDYGHEFKLGEKSPGTQERISTQETQPIQASKHRKPPIVFDLDSDSSPEL